MRRHLVRSTLTTLAVALLAPGCTQGGDQAPLTRGPRIEAVQAWFGEYTAAINDGILDRWIGFVADDAVIMPPDEPPIVGIDAIRPRYAAVFDAYSFQFRGGIQEIAVVGPMAMVRASIDETLTPKDGGPPMDLGGAWLMVLRQEADGSWKLWRNMWSVFPPTDGE
jgi:uncharacterized protein (TIGR02246 family)